MNKIKVISNCRLFTDIMDRVTKDIIIEDGTIINIVPTKYVCDYNNAEVNDSNKSSYF